MADQEYFDYTLATHWERLVAVLEQTCRSWLITGLDNILRAAYAAQLRARPTLVKVQAVVKHRLPWRREPYLLQLHLPTAPFQQRRCTAELPSAAATSAAPTCAPGTGSQVAADTATNVTQHGPTGQAEPSHGPADMSGGGSQLTLTTNRAGQQGLVSVGVSAFANTSESDSAATDYLHCLKEAPFEDQGSGNRGSGQYDLIQVAPLLSGQAGSSNTSLQMASLVEEYQRTCRQLLKRNSRSNGPGGSGKVHSDAPASSAHSSDSGGDHSDMASSTGATGTDGVSCVAAASAVIGRDAEAAAGSLKSAEEAAVAAVAAALAGATLAASRAETRHASGVRLAALPPSANKAGTSVGGRNGADGRSKCSGSASWCLDLDLDLDELISSLAHSGSPAQGAIEAHGVVAGQPVGADDVSGQQGKGPEQPTATVTSARAEGLTSVPAPSTHPPAANATACDSFNASGCSGDSNAVHPSRDHFSGSSGVAPQRTLLVASSIGVDDRRVVEMSAQWWPHRVARRAWWRINCQHKLQRWFGVDAFLLLSPKSYSGRLLDAAEASTLLSALLCALGSTGLTIPAFLPVHDALRDGVRGGVAIPSALSHPAGCRVQFAADSVHISKPPQSLTTTQGQLAAFAEQLAPTAPHAAAACSLAADHYADLAGAACFGSGEDTLAGGAAWSAAPPAPGLGDNTMAASVAALPALHDGVTVDVTAVYSFCIPELSANEAEVTSAGESTDDEGAVLYLDAAWDAAAPWQPWAAQRDPIQCCELDLVWEDVPLAGCRTALLAGRGGDTHGRLVPATAQHWVLHALVRGYGDSPGRGIGLRSYERSRQHVDLQRSGADWLWSVEAGERWQPPAESEGSFLAFPANNFGGPTSPRGATMPGGISGLHPGSSSFTMMLSALLCARSAAELVPSLGDLASSEWWESRGMEPPPVPPECVLQDVLRDLFDAALLPSSFHDSTQGWLQSHAATSRGARPAAASSTGIAAAATLGLLPFPRNAPTSGLLSRLALHSLVFGNARAIALLWQRCMREVRFSHWEPGTPLPRMRAAPAAAAAPGSTHSSTSSEVAASAARIAAASGQPVDGATLHPLLQPTPEPDVDLSCCLLHQKLQMLNVCIHRRDAAEQLKRGGTQAPPTTPFLSPPPSVAGTPYYPGDGSGGDTAPARPGGMPESLPVPPSAAATPSHAVDSSANNATGPSGVGRSGGGDNRWDVTGSDCDKQAQEGGAASPSRLDACRGQRGASASRSPANSVGGAGDESNSSFFSASEDEDFVGVRGAVGCVGYLPAPGLLRHPPTPAFSEDRLLERSTALAGLSSLVNGTEVVARLSSEALVSDMAAFKAANPGAVLQDFLRWHSPADVVASSHGKGTFQLSPRMACNSPSAGEAATRLGAQPCKEVQVGPSVDPEELSGLALPAGEANSRGPSAGGVPGKGEALTLPSTASSNPWHALWASTAACPAWEQKPLQDPCLEAERTLHDLDTLPPLVLFDQLFAVGLAAAIDALANSRGAALEPAGELVLKFHRLASNVLRKACSLDEQDAAAVAARGTAGRLPGGTGGMLVGLEPHEAEYLLGEFHYLEQVVVLSESLVLRLPGCEALAVSLLAHAVNGDAAAAAEGDYVYRAVAHADNLEQKMALARLMLPRNLPVKAADVSAWATVFSAASTSCGSVSASQPHRGQKYDAIHPAAVTQAWPAPIQQEWALFCSSRGSSREPAAEQHPESRFYVSAGGGEMRVAMTLVAED